MSFLLNTSGDTNTLWIILAIGAVLALCFYFKNKKADSNADNTNEVSSAQSAENANISVADDEEIIAVIAAAIAMAESESNGLKFRVVSFRRK